MKNIFIFTFLIILFLGFQISVEAKSCGSLSKRYTLQLNANISGNISTSSTLSCPYYLRQIGQRGNRYTYSGSDCSGRNQIVYITKACNSLSISLPYPTEGIELDSYGNVYTQTKNTLLNCNGSLNGMAVSANCSGTEYVGSTPFIITGNLYGSRIIQGFQVAESQTNDPAVSLDEANNRVKLFQGSTTSDSN